MNAPVKEASTANILLVLGVFLGILVGGRLYFIFEDQLKTSHRLANELKILEIRRVEVEIAQLKAKKD